MYRAFRGGRWPAVPSSFLLELPRAELEMIEPVISYQGAPGFHDATDSDTEWSQEGAEDLPVWEDRSASSDGNTGNPTGNHADNHAEADNASAGEEAPGQPALLPRMMTAAEMLGDDAPKVRASPDDFRQGMLVRHPEHGPGSIIALSGEGRKRKATVQFYNGEPAAVIHLAFSHLAPVKQPATEQ